MKLLLVILLFASSMFAQEFVKVAESEEASFYVDKKSIVKTDGVFKFTGKVEANKYVLTTEFATDCKNYITLFERAETAEEVLTRQKKVLVRQPIDPQTPLQLAINYVCYNTLKKDTPRITIPQAE